MGSEFSSTACICLYRDADNEKMWGEVIFAGEHEEAYEKASKEACHAQVFFVADQMRIPEVVLWQEDGWEPTVADHGWHQFWELTPSDRKPSGVRGQVIGQLLAEFCRLRRRCPRPNLSATITS